MAKPIVSGALLYLVTQLGTHYCCRPTNNLSVTDSFTVISRRNYVMEHIILLSWASKTFPRRFRDSFVTDLLNYLLTYGGYVICGKNLTQEFPRVARKVAIPSKNLKVCHHHYHHHKPHLVSGWVKWNRRVLLHVVKGKMEASRGLFAGAIPSVVKV